MTIDRISSILSILCVIGIVLQFTLFKGSTVAATVLLVLALATLGCVIYSIVKARKEK